MNIAESNSSIDDSTTECQPLVYILNPVGVRPSGTDVLTSQISHVVSLSQHFLRRGDIRPDFERISTHGPINKP